MEVSKICLMRPQSVKYELASFQIYLFDYKVLLLLLNLAFVYFKILHRKIGNVSASRHFFFSNPDDTEGRGVYWVMASL